MIRDRGLLSALWRLVRCWRFHCTSSVPSNNLNLPFPIHFATFKYVLRQSYLPLSVGSIAFPLPLHPPSQAHLNKFYLVSGRFWIWLNNKNVVRSTYTQDFCNNYNNDRVSLPFSKLKPKLTFSGSAIRNSVEALLKI